MSAKYYRLAAKSSSQVGSHSGLVRLQKLTHQSKKILDLGCGEGTRLNTLLKPSQKGFGIDISTYAINLAKKNYPRHHFRPYKGKKLPYKDNTFDLVYSAFVLEHTTDPQNFLSEAIRVLKPRGQLVLLCPNFGAPNRRSPCLPAGRPNSIENPFIKLLVGFLSDLFPPSSDRLHWRFVTPKKTYDRPDDDTTVEPYLHTLKRFLVNKHLRINDYSSLWSEELPTHNPRKLLFKKLGQKQIFPFNLYGPQIFLIATKLEAI